MFKVIMILASLLMINHNAQAENWTLLGILTIQNQKHHVLKHEFVRVEGFKNESDCWDASRRLGYSSEYAGQGGTNSKVPGYQWDFNSDCIKVNDE